MNINLKRLSVGNYIDKATNFKLYPLKIYKFRSIAEELSSSRARLGRRRDRSGGQLAGELHARHAHDHGRVSRGGRLLYRGGLQRQHGLVGGRRWPLHGRADRVRRDRRQNLGGGRASLRQAAQ